ncbi:alpha/beta hydrolase family protein [Neotabrizicola sp. VNH66]|uniref:alpha/beta hydrolase family protein n=1 Tax=Neotabrizicola sp. VNH66 TaxID=3400918 RepID=UPI003C030CED
MAQTFPALILAAFAALPARAETVTIPTPLGPLTGTLEVPHPAATAPAVLMLHGFTGTRDEAPVAGTGEGIFARTARLLADEGYVSLRIDFRGSGDSPGAFADTTPEGQIADGLAALDWLAAHPAVDPDRIAVLGWSLGGATAIAVAGRSGRPAALVLWNTVADPLDTFAGILGPATVETALTAAPDQTFTFAGLTLKSAFVQGLAAFDPKAELGRYQGPVFLAQGSADAVVAPEAADRLAAAHPQKTTRWSAAMDHAFNAGAGPETLDRLIAATAAFLAENLR